LFSAEKHRKLLKLIAVPGELLQVILRILSW